MEAFTNITVVVLNIFLALRRRSLNSAVCYLILATRTYGSYCGNKAASCELNQFQCRCLPQGGCLKITLWLRNAQALTFIKVNFLFNQGLMRIAEEVCYLMDILEKTEEHFQAGILHNKRVCKKKSKPFQGKTFCCN